MIIRRSTESMIFFIEKKCLDILTRNGYNNLRAVRLLQRLDRYTVGASWELRKEL